MDRQDETIMRMYFRLAECRYQRTRLQRIWAPETLNSKEPPRPYAYSTIIKYDELRLLGMGPEALRHWTTLEGEAKATLEMLAALHPLAEHFKQLKGFGMYTCGTFVAASGDIERAPTVSAFWKGMGLDLVDGVPPRRIRGKKDVERRIPCMPHVSEIGEQFRHRILFSSGKVRWWYDEFRKREERHVDKAKIFKMKSALRLTQKLLYSCLWREWRLAHGLLAPEPYAFAILQHDGQLVRVEDFYGPYPGGSAKVESGEDSLASEQE